MFAIGTAIHNYCYKCDENFCSKLFSYNQYRNVCCASDWGHVPVLFDILSSTGLIAAGVSLQAEGATGWPLTTLGACILALDGTILMKRGIEFGNGLYKNWKEGEEVRNRRQAEQDRLNNLLKSWDQAGYTK